jgi:hypothetical protein
MSAALQYLFSWTSKKIFTSVIKTWCSKELISGKANARKVKVIEVTEFPWLPE